MVSPEYQTRRLLALEQLYLRGVHPWDMIEKELKLIEMTDKDCQELKEHWDEQMIPDERTAVEKLKAAKKAQQIDQANYWRQGGK